MLILLCAALCPIHAIAQPVSAPSVNPVPSSFRVADDLQVAPLTGELTGMQVHTFDVDHKGRIWALEHDSLSGDGRNADASSQTKRITILEDPDRDGVTDKRNVFYKDSSLVSAESIILVGSRLMIANSQHFFLLSDMNGDGAADRRELLLSYQSSGATSPVKHLLFGPDGKVYFTWNGARPQFGRPQSKQCALHGDIPSAATSPLLDEKAFKAAASSRGGMIFRTDLDFTNLEAVAWGFGNLAGLAVDSFGSLWCVDQEHSRGKGPSRLLEVMAQGEYGYGTSRAPAQTSSPVQLDNPSPWHEEDPGVAPALLQLLESHPAGFLFYEGRTLPRRFWNRLLFCDSAQRKILACSLSPNGAGWKAEMEEIVTSADPNFAPSRLGVAPDGAVYFLDARAGGSFDGKGHAGGIYRLGRKGSRPSVPPQDWGSPHGWVGLLQSGSAAVRNAAMLKLRTSEEAEKFLLMLYRSTDPSYKARSLQLLSRLKGNEDKYISKCLQDTNASIRLVGLRAAEQGNRDLAPLIQQLVRDPSAQVRRECALLLRHIPAPEAAALWSELAVQFDGRDRSCLEALGIGAEGRWDSFLDAWLHKIGYANWDQGSGREIVWRSRSEKTAPLIAQLLKSEQLSTQDKQRYRRALDFVNGPEKEAVRKEFPDPSSTTK